MRRSSRHIRLAVFTIGVMMLLLRPYLVYQMTAANSRQNPARAWSLLQRLVKKKDDHHEQQADGAAVPAETACCGTHPVIRLLDTVIQLLHTTARAALAVPLLNSKYRLPAQQHLYRLTSCFLI